MPEWELGFQSQDFHRAPFASSPLWWVLASEFWFTRITQRGLWSSHLPNQQHTLKSPEDTAPHLTGSQGKLCLFTCFIAVPEGQHTVGTTWHQIVFCVLGLQWTYQVGSDTFSPKIFLMDRDLSVAFSSVTNKLCWLRFLSDHQQVPMRQKRVWLGR